MRKLAIVASLLLLLVAFADCGGEGPNHCVNQCGPGERQCYAGDSQLCEDTNGDGCLEWGRVEDCGAKTCVMGWCVDACTNLCSQAGEKRCEGNAVRTCTDTNGDGCLEWGSAVACQTGQTCSNGQCSCGNLCNTRGEKRCVGEGYQECTDTNGDGCLEWSDEKTCPAGQTCSQGQCSASCTNDCQPGQRECSGNAYRVCGNYDADSCSDWSGMTNCAASEVCQDGQCQPACANECSPSGSKRCYQNGFQTCSNYDTDPCLEWGRVIECKPGETCSNGVCSSNCTNECNTAGAKECVGAYPQAGWRECKEANDGDNCLDWVVHNCSSSEKCENAACVPYCKDECTPSGSRRCSGDGYQVCGNHDSDTCLEWSQVASCAPNSCSNGQCTGSCTDECSSAGTRVCAGTTGYQTCGNYDSDSCLDLSNVTNCGTGQTCQNGQCVAACTNECDWGTWGCSDQNTYWDCYDEDGDGCMEKVYGDCQSGYVCEEGWCVPQATCSDDSYEQNDTMATAQYASEGTHPGLQVCPNDDDYFYTYLFAGEKLEVAIYFTHSRGDLDLDIYNSAGTLVSFSASTTDNEQASVTASTEGTYYLRIYGYSGAQNSYTLNVTITPTATCSDDSYEENDTQATARTVGEGYLGGLKICSGDEDYFDTYLATGDQLSVTINFTHASGDLDMQLLSPSGSVLQSSTSSSNSESVSATATQSGYHAVRIYGVGGAENSYSMDVAVTPAATCTDDNYENNDSRSQAAELYPGTGSNSYNNLRICAYDEDWFSVELYSSETMVVTITFTNSSGDLDLYLYDSSGSEVDRSTSTNNSETVSVSASSSGYYYIMVSGYGGAENGYDMEISIY